jgi:branched-chain amino acid transport system substrate-binding protein
MHVNDTFGTAMAKGVGSIMPKHNMPYTIVEEIAYDPAAHDLSVEIAKAKSTSAEALMVVSRANDAILGGAFRPIGTGVPECRSG